MTARSAWRALVVTLLAAGCGEPETSLTDYCPGKVVINEVLSSGKVDWIELYNADDAAVEVEGWRLSRTPDEIEYEIPAAQPDGGGGTYTTALDPGAFLLVMADTYVEGELAQQNLVAGFDLNRDGDAVWLRADGAHDFHQCDLAAYPDQHDEVSWGRHPDGGESWCDQAQQSGGATNGACFPTDGG